MSSTAGPTVATNQHPSMAPPTQPVPVVPPMHHWAAPHTPQWTAALVGTGRRAPRRSLWPLWVSLAVVLAIVAGIGLVAFWPGRTTPDQLVAQAVDGMAGWAGVTYRGTVPAGAGGPATTIELTVTRDGSARGTLTRAAGGRAELLTDRAGALIKGDRAWWRTDLRQHADRLAEVWISEPTLGSTVRMITRQTPAELGSRFAGPADEQWTRTGDDDVDGRPVAVLRRHGQQLAVTADAPHRLVTVEIGGPGAGQPTATLRVEQANPESVAGIDGAAAGIRAAERPKTLREATARPRLLVTVLPSPPCTTPTCTVRVAVSNSGTSAASGRLNITADGRLIASHPFSLDPGVTTEFTGSLPNPGIGKPGGSGRVRIEAVAVPTG